MYPVRRAAGPLWSLRRPPQSSVQNSALDPPAENPGIQTLEIFFCCCCFFGESDEIIVLDNTASELFF